MLLAFLLGMAYLVFKGVATEGVRFFSGLAIGCPLGCYFFVLIVDPLLHALSAMGLSAFADDWSLFCRDLQTLFALRPLFQRLECASGQRINIPKSGILPTRPMTREEQRCVRIFGPLSRSWTNLVYSVSDLGSLRRSTISTQPPLTNFRAFCRILPPCARAGHWRCESRLRTLSCCRCLALSIDFSFCRPTSFSR